MNRIIEAALSPHEKRQAAGVQIMRGFYYMEPLNRQERRRAAKVKRQMAKAERQAKVHE